MLNFSNYDVELLKRIGYLLILTIMVALLSITVVALRARKPEKFKGLGFVPNDPWATKYSKPSQEDLMLEDGPNTKPVQEKTEDG